MCEKVVKKYYTKVGRTSDDCWRSRVKTLDRFKALVADDVYGCWEEVLCKDCNLVHEIWLSL